ncbi:MAG: hypothetical protein ACI8TQ_001278 [Planctomycetota bacterium]|jgi:hypothetical protein
MSLQLNAATTEQLAKLAPYARHIFDLAAEHALSLFADEIAPEHLLSTMMADDECAAYHAVIYAFADPQTIGRESLALSPGILVVSSSHSLPFSPTGVDALFAARKLALETKQEHVTPAILMLAAFDQLAPALMQKLIGAKFDRTKLGTHAQSTDTVEQSSISEEDALFACFAETTRRALGLACKIAKQNQRETISPAHMIGACAQRQNELADHGGLNAMQLSSLIGGDDADLNSPPPRPIPLDADLQSFLRELPSEPAGISSLALLDGFCRQGTGEVQGILKRSRISSELIQKIAASYTDPPSVP